jgi:cell wall assembly regulator SMI1
MAEIEESWARVTAWLAVNAPVSYARLRPPAPAAELERCDRDLGAGLPAELRRLLLVSNGAAEWDGATGTFHPGARFLPGGHRLLSAAEVAEASLGLVVVMDDLGFPELPGTWWDRGWVMFARHVAGDGMAIDQRPGLGQGAVGEFINEGSTTFTMATSLGEYLAKVADCVENGTDFRWNRPVVRDGALDWDVADATDYD